MKVKVRIAPSPTGFLHIGTAQSALYNWLFARKNKGQFFLRIEDTDKERSSKEYEQSILDALTWLGLQWDGDVVRQSERIEKYRAALEELLSNGKAFYCHHSQEELEAERKSQEETKQPPRHICDYKNKEEGQKTGGIIRLVTRDGTVTFDDEIRGNIKFEAALLGDFSIARSLDDSLYNFAVVVDDIDTGITHVIRGEDHISNTPKQILIYEALGKEIPKFAHLPLILATDRSKLSKRHGATAVVDYKKDYLPEALLNFLGAMSHTFSKELLTKEEMVQEFELSKVHKSGAVFNVKKLNWFNSEYIKKLSPEEFKKIADITGLPNSAILLIMERLEKLTDIKDFDYLFVKKPDYREKLIYHKDLLLGKDKNLEKTKEILKSIKSQIEIRGIEKIKEILEELSSKNGGRSPVYWPFRVALTGKEKSPDPVNVAKVFEDIAILNKTSRGDLVLMRIEDAIEKLE